MNVLILLALILFGLMFLIGGSKGFKSFISLFLNFIIILVTVFLMADPQANPNLIAILSCIVISSISLFYVNQINSKTIAAFISTILTVTLLVFIIYFFTKQARIQGFGEEEIDELIGVYTLYIGIDFVKLATSVVLMSTVGAVIDVAISITSPMQEILQQHPEISRKELFLSGLTIGKDILGSNANTLFFAFIGSYLALFLWFKDLAYSFGQIMNSKIFSAEMITIFCAGIGIAMAIPITSWVGAFYFDKKRIQIIK